MRPSSVSKTYFSNNFSFTVEAAADSFTFHFSFRRAGTDLQSFYFFNMWLFRVSVTEAYLMFCKLENMQAYQ